MSEPLLLIITGLPCTGKTTLAKWLAPQLSLPLIYKDGIKELLFDELGWSDRTWSRKLGKTSINLLFYLTETQLQAGQSLIVESPFIPSIANNDFLTLKEKYPFYPLQIQCVCDSPTLLRRFEQRSLSSERHPGHVDHLNIAEFATRLRTNDFEPLRIGGSLYTIDTTNFQALDYTKIISDLREIIATHL